MGKKIIDKINNVIADIDDSISSTSSRAGRVIQRVGNMTKANVSARTQATQMTDNSPTGQTYYESDIYAYQKLAIDSKTKVVITQEQAQALIEDALGGDEGETKPAT